MTRTRLRRYTVLVAVDRATGEDDPRVGLWAFADDERAKFVQVALMARGSRFPRSSHRLRTLHVVEERGRS